MKYTLYLFIFSGILVFGSCSQKKMANQLDRAKSAQLEAEKQRQMAELARMKALQSQKRANEAVALAQQEKRMADMARQRAILAQKKCEEENIRIQQKIQELEKKK
ncbi:MAG TPA: hypothetical protein DCS93_12175 [Microscillaceae bacterium]|nr:hypothetical protein [Microscillaceae bacterium]